MDIFEKLANLRKNTGPALPPGPPQFLLIGLGNPGKQYDNTRHNAGFDAVDTAAQKAGVTIDNIKFKSLTKEAAIGGKKVLFMKPGTFMNLSGNAVVEAMNFYKIPMQNIIVFCDDVNFPVAKVRIRPSGSDGGHNGLKNIIYLTGSNSFPRVRIGVGQKPHPAYDLADWVLGQFDKKEQEELAKVYQNAYNMVEIIVTQGVQAAMAKYN